MEINRRGWLKIAGTALAAAATGGSSASAQPHPAASDAYGCLVDLTRCIGCRKCEEACNGQHGLPAPDASFEDLTVLDRKRRPDEKSYTVVNRYVSGKVDKQNRLVPTFVKIQCMHCADPACASACIVGALKKQKSGAVTYDASKCIGCRYCMVACPFEIPAYEYHEPLTPRVMKCTFCQERITTRNIPPACASVCPVEAITFGKREALVELGHRRIQDNPSKYIDHIYGEKEVGGTSWMYLSAVPFEKLGFIKAPLEPTPRLAETIQHSLFSYLWSPILLYGALAGIMRRTHADRHSESKGGDS